MRGTRNRGTSGLQRTHGALTGSYTRVVIGSEYCRLKVVCASAAVSYVDFMRLDGPLPGSCVRSHDSNGQ